MTDPTRQPIPERSRNYTSGGQRRTRDQERMAAYIGRKEFTRPGGWADDKEGEYLATQPKPNQNRQRRNNQRAKNWRTGSKPQRVPDSTNTSEPTSVGGETTDKYMSTSSTQPKDDPLYNFTQGSRQLIKRRCQNIEHSSFTELCDVVYRQLREFAPRLRREMPYTVFLHAMNTVLQAFMIDTARNLNQESRWQDEDQPMSTIPREMVLPAPIAEYLSLINTNIIPSGDTVRINVPDAIIPGIEIAAAGEEDIHQPAGTFGLVTAENHNAYETNISPYVTMRNIQSQARQAQLTPLPDGYVPEGARPTRNLLGYVPYIDPGPEVRAQLQEYEFPEGAGIAARLRLCPALMVDVSATLHRLSDKMKVVKIQDLVRKPSVACTVYNTYPERRTEDQNTAVLAQQTPTISALFSFGTTTASQATIFGFKKQRTNAVRGFCYVMQNDRALGGWNATRNSFFKYGRTIRTSRRSRLRCSQDSGCP